MTSRFFIINVLLLFLTGFLYSQNPITLNGYVTDNSTGEALIGASIYSKTYGRGTITNAYGFYSLTLPNDTGTVFFSFIGYQTQIIKFSEENSEEQLNIKLSENTNEISEVQVIGNSVEKEVLKSVEGSVVKVPMKELKLIPSILGESDIIRAVQLMPGITTGGEISSSFFVRGGEADQNLIILDEAVVYNSGHLLAFFSVFNSDVIKDVKLYKGGFPANYGGRLSSVMDVRMKDGNLNEFHGIGNIGLLSSKITLEGPIVKEKLSFVLSARRTYVDKVYGLLGAEIPYYFYDLNAKINWKIGKKDRLFFSTYLGNDVLYMPDIEVVEEDQDTDSTYTISQPKFGFTLGNKTMTMRWNHQFNSKLFANTSLIYNNFNYDLEAEDGFNVLLISSSLEDYTFKTDFDYNLNSKNKISFGGLATQHIFKPNMVFTKGEIGDYLNSQESLDLETIEMCGYILDEIDFNQKLKANIGLRYAYNINKEIYYQGLEPRFFLNWMINEKNSLKTGYSRMKQYLHRVSSSNFIMPTDMYYPITEKVKPQQSDQVFLSYSRNFPDWGLILTSEVYYKNMTNLIEFQEGTRLFLNNNFENDMLSGTGDSKGFEFFLQKTQGDFTGWISYTFSQTNRHFEEINYGEVFPAKNDRRHNFSLVGILKLSEKFDLSASYIYMTGARFTPIVSQYIMPNPAQTGYEVIPIFSKRNAIEMSPNYRLDVNLTFKPHFGKNKRFKTEWQFGVYNLTNRAAPFNIEIVYDERGFYEYQQPGLFGRLFNVSFNFFF